MKQNEQLGPTTAPLENTDTAQFEEVLARFADMLSHADFGAQLETLGIGRFQFTRRKQARQELGAMYVGLWKLALNRSFPTEANALLEKFLTQLCETKSKSKRRKQEHFVALCREYVHVLQTSGDTNFIQIAVLLCQHLDCHDQDALRRISLQIALDMRAMYHHIFERLI